MNIGNQPARAIAAADTPAARSHRDYFEAGYHAGFTKLPIPATANQSWRQGWTAGDVQRRAEMGEVVSTFCPGSRCTACQTIAHGLRKVCKCWTVFGFNHTAYVKAGHRIEWGMLVAASAEVTNVGEHTFMSREELLRARDAGRTIVNAASGKPLLVDDM